MWRSVTSRVLCGLFLLAADQARAEVLVHDQFNTDGALNGMVPTPGPGVAWNAGGGTGSNPMQIAGGQAVVIQTDAGTNGEDVANVFADRTATATTYARFDFRLPAADNTTLASDVDVTGEGVFFVTLRGTSANSTQRARFGVLGPAAAGDFRIAINTDASDLSLGGIWAGDLEFDATYRAVISYNATLGESKLWLNPANEMSTNVADTGAASTVINRVILRQNDDYAGKQLVDNVVVATSFAEALSGGVNFLPADFDKDGFVDGDDLEQWKTNFGTGVDADADGDLDSDGADFLVWQRQLGQLPVAAVTAAPVPEPVGALLASVGFAAALVQRRSQLSTT